MSAVEDPPQQAGDEAEEQEPSSAEKAQMEMRRRIMKIMMDTTLTDAEKAQKRQDLMSGKWADEDDTKNKPGEQLGRGQGLAVRLQGAEVFAALHVRTSQPL